MVNPNENLNTNSGGQSANEAFVSALTLNQSALRGYCQSSLGHGPTSKDKRFTTEVHFDRPIIGIIAHKDLLAQFDPLLAHPHADFGGQVNRGLNKNDEVTLSADRRTIRVAFDIEDGVDQIRVLVASHFPEPLKRKSGIKTIVPDEHKQTK